MKEIVTAVEVERERMLRCTRSGDSVLKSVPVSEKDREAQGNFRPKETKVMSVCTDQVGCVLL